MNEKISALIDRQGTPRQRREAFDRLLADDGARRRRCRCQVWQRYHLIGCVLRGEVEQTGADLGERIRARLEDEPTVLAPVARSSSARTVARIISWKSAGLPALAASVALAAVITLQPTGEEGAGAGGANPIAGIADTADGHGARFAQEVGEMLAQHGEFTSSPGLNGLVVYAKLVSNEPIER